MKTFQCSKCHRYYQDADASNATESQLEEVFPSEPDEVFYEQISSEEEDNEDVAMPMTPPPAASPPTCPQCGANLLLLKHWQQAQLPAAAKLVATSPEFTEKTLPAPIRNRHMAPQGKCARLLVSEGDLQFVWEDTHEVFDADAEHPIIIYPERYHHVAVSGPVRFRLEFYHLPALGKEFDPDAVRPGEAYTK